MLSILLSTSVTHAADVSVAFANGKDDPVGQNAAQNMVINIINSATQSIDVIAYAFQSTDIAQALADKAKAGIPVRLVVDEKRNTGKSYQTALQIVRGAGGQVRESNYYHIQHDKTIIVDNKIVETGSFNYANSTETENSKNTVLIQNAPDVAAAYEAHFIGRFNKGH